MPTLEVVNQVIQVTVHLLHCYIDPGQNNKASDSGLKKKKKGDIITTSIDFFQIEYLSIGLQVWLLKIIAWM